MESFVLLTLHSGEPLNLDKKKRQDYSQNFAKFFRAAVLLNTCKQVLVFSQLETSGLSPDRYDKYIPLTGLVTQKDLCVSSLVESVELIHNCFDINSSSAH